MVQRLGLLGFPLQVNLLHLRGFAGPCEADTDSKVPQSRVLSPLLWTTALLRELTGSLHGEADVPWGPGPRYPFQKALEELPQGCCSRKPQPPAPGRALVLGVGRLQEGLGGLAEPPDLPVPKEPLPVPCYLTEGCEELLSHGPQPCRCQRGAPGVPCAAGVETGSTYPRVARPRLSQSLCPAEPALSTSGPGHSDGPAWDRRGSAPPAPSSIA